VNGYTGPLVYGGNSDGADRPVAGRADGYVPSVWTGYAGSPTDLRKRVSRLIEARNPEAALAAAVLYLQEADRILAESAQQFSEARQIAALAADEHAKLAVDRERIGHALREVERERRELQVRGREIDSAIDSMSMRRASLEALEITLMTQSEALESREASLEALETEVMLQKEALENEQKKLRRRAIEAPPLPTFPDSGPLHLRPDPRAARTPHEFMQCLTAFRKWSGNRSLRQISEQSGHRISPSGVRNVLNSSDLPDRLEVVDAMVMGCGGSEGDRAAFASAWRRLYMGSGESTIIDVASPHRAFE
jgi:hypothetical protein